MKKTFLFLCTIFCTMILLGCGKISTLKFYEACLNGDEKIVNEYLSSENFSIELSENETSKFIEVLEKFDTESLFYFEYEDVFIENPIAVSILGKNNSITKLLCEKIPLENINHDNIVYACAKMNNTEMGNYLFEQNILPTTYLPFISMIENDNIDMFKLFSTIIDDITEEVYKTGENFLIVAVKNNSVNCVKYLVDTKKFDINAMNNNLQTALGYAYDYSASDEIKNYLKNAGGKYIRKPYLDFITEMKRLSNILLDHCDKSKYSHSEVMEIVHDMGYSGTFMNRANELSQKCAGLEPTELESNHLYKSIDEFDSAWAQLQSKRMFD
ncbi:MAG: ankyrin repeat domain-containing protein [Spirochaetaceae bacterium]|nr:ankyrin repeat domain-containing protein [Spirochaetaceae bacterium]